MKKLLLFVSLATVFNYYAAEEDKSDNDTSGYIDPADFLSSLDLSGPSIDDNSSYESSSVDIHDPIHLGSRPSFFTDYHNYNAPSGHDYDASDYSGGDSSSFESSSSSFGTGESSSAMTDLTSSEYFLLHSEDAPVSTPPSREAPSSRKPSDSSDSSVDRNAEYFWKHGHNSHYGKRKVSEDSTDSQRANPADDVRYNPDDEGRRNPYSDQIDVRHNIDDSYVYNPSDRDAYNPNDFEHIQLQAAIQQSNQEAIKYYLDQGADLQKHTGVGGSPLIFSAVQQYINAFTDEAEKEAREVVLTLLQRGANIHQRGQRGPDQRPPLLRGVQYWSSGNLKKFLTGFDEFITVTMLQEAINEAVDLQRESKTPQFYDTKIKLLHKSLKKKDD